VTPDTLEAYARVMRSNGVLRVTGEEKEDGLDFTIELYPSVFEPRTDAKDTALPMPVDLDDGEKCACGCLRDTEHNAQGLCIGKGCPVSLCSPEVKPSPIPG